VHVDPVLTQQDPIGLAGGLNLYGFAGGDPANGSDPFGLHVTPIGHAANYAVARLMDGSRTFRRLYQALHRVDASRVSVVIRSARSAREIGFLERSGPAMTERYIVNNRRTASGVILWHDNTDGDRAVTLLAHEIVHAAGAYAEIIGDETGVPRECSYVHPNTTNPCVTPIEDQINSEMRMSRLPTGHSTSERRAAREAFVRFEDN